MPKAEVGSTKWVANKSKAKGLQRLRWYCQVCAKQCRDENGFKQHTLSEGHVRQMMLVGEDPRKYINNYSTQFKRDFIQLLRTSHGEKKIHINHFYNEYIKDKEHVHMNATRWNSLTEFAKYLGREGICRVEEGERGLTIQWIDDSPEAIKRREDVKNKDRLAKGEEDLESRLLAQQIRKAQAEAKAAAAAATASALPVESAQEAVAPLSSVDEQPAKTSFTFNMGPSNDKPREQTDTNNVQEQALESFSSKDIATPQAETESKSDSQAPATAQACAPKTFSLSGSITRPVETMPFSAKPVAKPSTKPTAKKVHRAPEPVKKMSNAERIMREEMDRKRQRDERGSGNGYKRARYD